MIIFLPMTEAEKVRIEEKVIDDYQGGVIWFAILKVSIALILEVIDIYSESIKWVVNVLGLCTGFRSSFRTPSGYYIWVLALVHLSKCKWEDGWFVGVSHINQNFLWNNKQSTNWIFRVSNSSRIQQRILLCCRVKRESWIGAVDIGPGVP